MKHLLKKSGLQRLMVAALTAFACVCMWGGVVIRWSLNGLEGGICQLPVL